MFTWLAILCCHLVCGGGRRSRHASLTQARQKETQKRKRSGHRMMHGKAIWKPGIAEIVKAPRDFAPLEPPAARASVLTHVALWPTTIKLKSRGQQKCFDKTLLWQITIISLWCCLYFSVSSTFNFAYLNFPQNANVSDNVQWLHSTRLPTSLNWYFLSHFLSSMIFITFCYLTIKICKYPN